MRGLSFPASWRVPTSASAAWKRCAKHTPKHTREAPKADKNEIPTTTRYTHDVPIFQ
jgi:hypothetical protein